MKYRVLAAVVGAFALSVGAQNDPSREPFLRIETGMHTAVINRISVDRSGTWLVTASADKTVRVWELATGKLLRVLRVPIGEGREGQLYAVAISPDGRTIATGGWTSGDGQTESVYLFDRESGRLVRRLPGLLRVVDHLTFSPDGARLAATVGTSGVLLWRTSDWTEIVGNAECGRRSFGADFDRDGRLVTGCYDGALRLYDREMRLLVKQDATGGKQPFKVAFSPDGRTVAVGYTDSTNIDVLSGDTLMLLYRANTTDVTSGNLSTIAWSADGTMLYAGGTFPLPGTTVIRRWSDAGRGPHVDTPVSNSTVMDFATLPDGGIVYGAADPAWGVLDAKGTASPRQAPQTPDFRGLESDFLTDETGSVIRFGYEASGASPAVFHLGDRALILDPPAADSLRPPRTDAPGLSIKEWLNTTAPTLNSTPLTMSTYDRSRGLAIVPGGDRFVLGTSFSVILFDRTGKEIWQVPAPETTWAVNVSGDGRYVLAVHGDGTIRWYRATDGTELLAFFPHADRKRWVIWTPSGYYDASPGGEDLIGWHVNGGRSQAADFYPVGQFRSTYYRPDVVAQLLATGDEAKALELANAAAGRRTEVNLALQLPPVVEIISPKDRSDVSAKTVTVSFTVRSPSGEPVTNVRALVDGRPAQSIVQPGQAGASAGVVREIRVTIPERDSEVAIIAENRFAASVPATVRLAWTGPVPRGVSVTTDGFVVRPKLYVLAIGVSVYGNPQYNLNYAAKDARDFVAAMQTQKGGLYRDVIVYGNAAVTDGAATKEEILDGFDWIRKETTSNDVAMVFLAGHGVNDQNNDYFFYPHNVNADRMLRTGVGFYEIKKVLSAIAGKALFFVDTCHSGNSIGQAGRRDVTDINIVINELSSAQNGVIVFSASTGGESSYERPEWNNGAFTKALVEGLLGEAAMGTTGRITYNMLNVYISERVKELTKGQQHPTMISPQTVPDFPIAVKR